MFRPGVVLVWVALALLVALPIAVAADSPLLAWRRPVYIVAGFAGILAMALLLVQPLLATGDLPGLPDRDGRRLHRIAGPALIAAVTGHVGGLWITSPPDVVDALTFTSATPFAAWGVIAMWAAFAAAGVAALRRRLHPRRWRQTHMSLTAIACGGSVVHALMIEGTMGTLTKIAICVSAILATLRALQKRWPRRA